MMAKIRGNKESALPVVLFWSGIFLIGIADRIPLIVDNTAIMWSVTAVCVAMLAIGIMSMLELRQKKRVYINMAAFILVAIVMTALK